MCLPLPPSTYRATLSQARPRCFGAGCGLLLVSLYVAFDLLDVDGSDFGTSPEVAIARVEDAAGKQSRLPGG
jgi:hypothetical protein